MSDEGQVPQERRTRKRNTVAEDKRGELVEMILRQYNGEVTNRSPERERRLQRYAKYRMWTEATNWPWPDAANTAIPDMLQDSLRVQDTLHNAVMSQRPPVSATATLDADDKKARMIDDLIQVQIFVEQPGEKIIGDMIEGFVNDPAATVYTPWVREKRQIAEAKIFDDGIPSDKSAKSHFFDLLRQEYPKATEYQQSDDGWDATVIFEKEKDLKVGFFTNEDGGVELVAQREVVVYDGPRMMFKDYDDVIFPARSANLQPPGPSNPGGAPWVILRDSPDVAEIQMLQKRKYYDMISDEEAMALEAAQPALATESPSQKQKDDLSGAGQSPGRAENKGDTQQTRLIWFGRVDFDGNGKPEDAVVWVLKEAKKLLRVRRLSDVNPGSPPARPLAGGSFLPVGGRYSGMSLLEIMETTHDTTKVLLDQGINAQDLAIGSPGWYRPSGGMNPEVLRIEPFTLNPLQNPQQDVVFPQMGNPNAMGAGMNLISMLSAWQDKITMVGDLQFGNIPSGGSSALRTIGGMSLAMGQGEARPERILRRFFSILTDVYSQVHRLNQNFLPKAKQFRIAGVSMPGEDPLRKIDAETVEADYRFTFDANAFNTSKMALQQNLEGIGRALINPLMLQTGIVQPENIYNWAYDYVMAKGQNVRRYISPPKGEPDGPRILAEEAIQAIMNNQLPEGMALEAGGPEAHMQTLIAFMESPEFGHLSDAQVDLFRQYLLKVREQVAAAAQQAAMLQAAGQFGQQMQQKGPGAPVTAGPQTMPNQPAQISGPHEMQDETLPTAGGGANA